jgi:hypothetical protein
LWQSPGQQHQAQKFFAFFQKRSPSLPSLDLSAPRFYPDRSLPGTWTGRGGLRPPFLHFANRDYWRNLNKKGKRRDQAH